MSELTYTGKSVADPGKPLIWLHGEVRTPPFGLAARIEAGMLLRRLQNGESLAMPHSRPMPSIGARCHELRVRDRDSNWRILYRIDLDAIVIAGVFAKKSSATPDHVINTAKDRLRRYDSV